MAHVNDAPPLLSDSGPHAIPVDLERVLQACLAKSPDDRPCDAGAPLDLLDCVDRADL